MDRSNSLDFAHLFAPGLPPPATKWTGFAKYNFIGGHNDADQVTLDALLKAANDVLAREGRTLATYGLASGPLGYRALREFLTRKLERNAGISLRCRRDPHHLRLAASARSGQRHSACARRYRHYRTGDLSGRADASATARRRSGRHPARRRGHAHGCARRRPRSAQAPRRATEIHLHDSDRAKSDRDDLKRGATPRNAPARRAIRRADLRGRLLCRPDLGRQAAAGALCHERAWRGDPCRLVLEVSGPGFARRLHRRAVAAVVTDAAAQDRCRLRGT